MSKVYHIDFNTKDMPGKILAVRVDLARELIRDEKQSFNIALCDDPNYPALERYVRLNPSKKGKP